jgi:hypothetical protein
MQRIIDQVNAMNDDNAANQPMVYQVWEDGEITIQKAGELLWQRNLHCVQPGCPDKTLPIDALCHKYNSHSYIFCATREVAVHAADLICMRE